MVWDGIVMSKAEIKEKYYKMKSVYEDIHAEYVSREEFEENIATVFEIPIEVAKAYVMIACTRFSTDWYAVLDNIVKLMEVKLPHDVYEMLICSGEEATVENAKRHCKR